jgi:hypothetical protein
MIRGDRCVSVLQKERSDNWDTLHDKVIINLKLRLLGGPVCVLLGFRHPPFVSEKRNLHEKAPWITYSADTKKDKV